MGLPRALQTVRCRSFLILPVKMFRHGLDLKLTQLSMTFSEPDFKAELDLKLTHF